jgi:hypothetical protein
VPSCGVIVAPQGCASHFPRVRAPMLMSASRSQTAFCRIYLLFIFCAS